MCGSSTSSSDPLDLPIAFRFVPNARWVSGRQLPSTCLALQSPPLHCAANSVVTDLVVPIEGAAVGEADQVLVVLSKGHLHLYHSDSGIKVSGLCCLLGN